MDLEAQRRVGAIPSDEQLGQLESPRRYSSDQPRSASIEDERQLSTATSFRAKLRRGASLAASSRLSDSDDEDELEYQALFTFADEMRNEKSTGDPFFPEMTLLQNMNILQISRQLAAVKRKILKGETMTPKDMRRLRRLLHDQANAARDLQTIRSMKRLSPGKYKERLDQCSKHFFDTTFGNHQDSSFHGASFRYVPRPPQRDLGDAVRVFIRDYFPLTFTWSESEKRAAPDEYRAGKRYEGYAPRELSESAEALARFAIAMIGALFILVPMYIMALHENRNKNLITTTIAVLLFAILCSVALRTSIDQTLAATAGYAAVLMVFVGLTSTSTSTN